MRMEQVRTLNIRGSRETLQKALVDDVVGESLREPLQAIAGELAVRTAKAPISVYICSADTDADLRNYLAFVVARAVQSRVHNLVVVDCDFLSVGLSKIVPERDALGFLDLLLYGSSLDVITQKTAGGIPVIGAGSFPVSRKSPFVMDAFEETVRYLSNHAGCVLFCGPVLDDDNNIHPILGGVQLRILVRSGKPQRPNALDAVEEKVAAVGGETWMVRVAEAREPVAWQKERAAKDAAAPPRAATEPAAGTDVAEPPRTTARAASRTGTKDAEVPKTKREGGAGERWARGRARPVAKKSEKKTAAPGSAGSPEETPPKWDEVHEVTIERGSGSSLFPRIIIATLGVLLIGFVAWWLYLTRSIREQVEAPFDMTQVETPRPAPGDAGSQGAEAGTPTGGTEAGTGEEANAAAPGSKAAVPEAGSTTGNAPAGESPATEPPQQQPVATTHQEPTATPREEPPAQVPTASRPSGTVSLMDELAPYAGEYLIHVSSFRLKNHAQSDADYLTGRGYSTIIARVDLGDKGLWYRVYVGPFTSQAEAQRMKIRLDENPRVLSTRITKVPG